MRSLGGSGSLWAAGGGQVLMDNSAGQSLYATIQHWVPSPMPDLWNDPHIRPPTDLPIWRADNSSDAVLGTPRSLEPVLGTPRSPEPVLGTPGASNTVQRAPKTALCSRSAGRASQRLFAALQTPWRYTHNSRTALTPWMSPQAGQPPLLRGHMAPPLAHARPSPNSAPSGAGVSPSYLPPQVGAAAPAGLPPARCCLAGGTLRTV